MVILYTENSLTDFFLNFHLDVWSNRYIFSWSVRKSIVNVVRFSWNYSLLAICSFSLISQWYMSLMDVQMQACHQPTASSLRADAYTALLADFQRLSLPFSFIVQHLLLLSFRYLHIYVFFNWSISPLKRCISTFAYVCPLFTVISVGDRD